MNPFRTLFFRLSLALLAIIALAGGAFFIVEQYSLRNYHEEITQRLNAAIAMYVTGERQLIENGQVNRQALETLSQQAMVINPTVEIYLLGLDGRIIDHAVPPDSLRTDRVDLAPVQALIGGEASMPLRGTDPRSEREKVFSAHPVLQDDELQGYLYAVLGGQKYDAIADSVRGSHVQRVSIGAALAITGAAFAAGLLVFGLLTRRLARLTADVRAFTATGLTGDTPPPRIPAARTPGRDEIGELRAAFARMADKLIEQFDDLKETDRLRRELISNVSHDLRTPLASMHGYVETLLIRNDRMDADERRRYLEITRKHSLRLRRLIGDLFELSKLESASIQPAPEAFSLAELLQDVTQEFELEAERRGISMKVAGQPAGSRVFADIGLVQRVLENLVRNAIRHTPAGGEVTLTLEPRPDRVAVEVADTGCGIPADELEHVFDRCYRGKSPDEASDSAGLGLAIVHKILDLHDSRITVTSEVDRGTTFRFDLPTAA
ncbi:sensor histidine kinase [Marinihelvus fidelis]|nr:ATP-binding protein [Marinihelvus fidelis]